MRNLLCLTALLLGASGARAQPKEPTSKMVGGRSGPITGFVEEKNTFTAVTPKGKFEVVVEPSAREARKLIHAQRSKELHGGKDLAVEQKEMNARIKKNTGAYDNYASVYIGITSDGVLVGANKFKGPGKNDHTVNTFALDGGGKTKRVVMSGGTRNKQPAVFVRISEDGDTDKIWMVLTYVDTLTMKMDFEVRGSAAGGGGPAEKFNPNHIDVYPDDDDDKKPSGAKPSTGGSGHIDVYPDEPEKPKNDDLGGRL